MSLLSATKRLAKKALMPGRAEASDTRGKKIVVVIHCILNQNSRDAGAACCPAMNRELLSLCQAHDIGIVQMPCPEISVLGLQRQRAAGQSIREAMDTTGGRSICRRISEDTADLLQDYLRNGYRVIAILGGNEQSPGCAVHSSTGSDGQQRIIETAGILIQQLGEVLSERNMPIPIRPIRDADRKKFDEDLRWFEERLR